MNRRGFLTSLAALGTSAVLPTTPSIPFLAVPFVRPTAREELIKMLYHGMMYGKTFRGGRVVYFDTDGVFTTDTVSAYPSEPINPRINPWSSHSSRRTG